MSSIVFDIGNFVIWGWMILAPVVYCTLMGIHAVDKVLRNDYSHVGFRWWNGKWYRLAEDGLFHLIAIFWTACVAAVAIVYGDMRHEWDLFPLFLHLIDCSAEPVGWVVVAVIPVILLKIFPRLIAFFICKWSK